MILTETYSSLFTYLLHGAESFLRSSPVLQLVNKFPVFYGTQRFIIAFTSARRLSLSWTSFIQSIPPYPTSWKSLLILSSHLRLGLPSGLLPSGFLTKTLYTLLPLPIRATCPAHLILLDFVTLTILGEQYRSLSSPLCSFLRYPVTSSLLGRNYTNHFNILTEETLINYYTAVLRSYQVRTDETNWITDDRFGGTEEGQL